MKTWRSDKLILFHAPKTAGTSVLTFLTDNLGSISAPLEIAHATYLEGKRFINKDSNCFTIIRNPYERAVSYYFWFRSNAIDKFYPNKRYAALMSFEDWIINRYNTDTIPQEFFHGPEVVVIKQENLIQDLDKFLNERLNLNLDLNKLPHMYKTNHRHYSNYITEVTEKIIYNKECYIFDSGFYDRIFFNGRH